MQSNNREAQYLISRFDEHLVGLIQYGSTVFGQTRAGSVCDFWVIVGDIERFHRSAAMRATHRSNHDHHLSEHIRLNKNGPNFYAIHDAGLRMKIAVIGVDAFARLCRSETYLVKGRMQKPLRILRASPEVAAAIYAARGDGVGEALNLLPAEFSFEQFLRTLVGLSYRAEIRPEFLPRKIESIISTGRERLEAIYLPLLEERPEVEKAGAIYRDRRAPRARNRARRATLRRIRRCKWSREGFGAIWKNYRTHARPLLYLYMKIRGEFEKARRG